MAIITNPSEHLFRHKHNKITNLNWANAGHTIDANIVPVASGVYSLGTASLRYHGVNTEELNAYDITTNSITAENNYLQFQGGYILDTAPVGTDIFSKGKVYYDSTWNTMAIQCGRDVTMQVGQEEWRRIYNNTGQTITNGQVVYTNGVFAGPPAVATVALAQANNSSTYTALGLATQDIPDGEYGFITVRGHVNGLNTTYIGRSRVTTQGLLLLAKVGGTATNSYTFTVIDSTTGGLSYTEAGNAFQLDLGGTTPTSAQVVAEITAHDATNSIKAIVASATTVVVAGAVNFAFGVNTAAGDSVYLSSVVAGDVTTVAPTTPNYELRLGRLIVKDATDGIINVRLINSYSLDNLVDVTAPSPITNDLLKFDGSKWVNNTISLDELNDVITSTPTTDQVLRYNGANWINGNPVTVSAGVGVTFYPSEAPEAVPGVGSLLKAPPTEGEQVEPVSVNESTAWIDGYIYSDPLQIQQIDAGRWTFNTYAKCDVLDGTSEIIGSIAHIILGDGAVSTTGTGTTRTIDASGSTPFLLSDYNADVTLTAGIITPSGEFDVAGYTSSSELTINTPNDYENETHVPFKIARVLFTTTTGKIGSTETSLYTSTSVQPVFLTDLTDSIGITYYAKTTNNSATSVSLVHSGSAHCTSFLTPLVIRHNDLTGLQGGDSTERYHLTSTEYTKQLPPTVSGQTGKVLTNDGASGYWEAASILQGTSGYSGYSGEAFVGSSGYSGYSGESGYSGYSGYSGISGYSGYSGVSGYSGYSGYSGISGYSGYSGESGYSGYSGSGVSGYSGYSGSGVSGYSGYSGYSGISGYSGYSGISGYSGYSSDSGYSGYSGYSGSGVSGYSGYSGSGVSGYSGYSGHSGYSGYSGYSGISGYSGYSGVSGYSGYSGISGYSGYSGQSGYSGYSGHSGYSGYSGTSGYSAYSGYSGHSYTLVANLASPVNTAGDTNSVDVTGLVWTYAANSTYLFRLIGTAQTANANTGFGFGINVSSVVTDLVMGAMAPISSGANGGASGPACSTSVADDTIYSWTNAVATANVPMAVWGQGLLRTTGNTGTAQLRFRSETTTVATVNAGFTLVVEKVA